MDHEVTLEDGEISNDSDNNYTPLERPTNYSQVQPLRKFPVILNETDSEIESSETDSSDSDCKPTKKKPKIKIKPKQVLTKRKKNYDIWSTKVQDDVLAETLNSCDVSSKDRSRDVESYDYTLGHKYYNKSETERTNNKRTRCDRKNVNFKQKQRSNSNDKKRGSSRQIAELAVNAESSPEDVTRDIANKLFEEKQDLIGRVISIMGVKRSIEIFNETREIEKEGGMMTLNQTRRRTPGGVFLYLVRTDYHITPEERKQIFLEEKELNKQQVKQKQKLKALAQKQKIAASKLPELLTKAEVLTRNIKKDPDGSDVVNPPPTPETDHHENSGDGMDNISPLPPPIINDEKRPIQSYDDDFLDIGTSNDMDLF